jgi:hypothetical protein
MFIRQTKKQRQSTGKTYYQFSLVQSVRIDGKSRQRTILYLGSAGELRDKTNRKLVLEALKAMITGSPSLFEDTPAPLYKLAEDYYQQYKIKYEGVEDPITAQPESDETTYEEIATDRVETIEAKSFGPEHLCLQALQKLKLGSFLSQLGPGADDVDRALISIAACAIYTASEHQTADILQLNSSLTECMGCREPITHKQLYRIADILFNNKQAIDGYLYDHITDMFDIEDSMVIFDISNTYFESRKAGSQLAAYGRSNQKRGDCPIVVFSGVINAEGFIRHSRIYQGNPPDQQTLSDMVDGFAGPQWRVEKNSGYGCGDSHRAECRTLGQQRLPVCVRLAQPGEGLSSRAAKNPREQADRPGKTTSEPVGVHPRGLSRHVDAGRKRGEKGQRAIYARQTARPF